MGILSRLIDLARSRVEADRPDAYARDSRVHGPGSEAEWGSSADGGSAAADEPPARDPRLAECYANLEVPYGADMNTVRAAWRQLVKQYHPDLHALDPERRRVADELTAQLTLAYRHLEDHALADSPVGTDCR